MKKLMFVLLPLFLSSASAQIKPQPSMFGLMDVWAVCPIHGDEGVSGKFWLEVTPAYRSAQAVHLKIVPLDAVVPFSSLEAVETVEAGDVKVNVENGDYSLLVSSGVRGTAIVMTVAYKGIAPSTIDASIIYNNRIYSADCIILNQRERSRS